MSSTLVLNLAAVRAAFPALASGYIFADNAGGSQCLASVVGAISDYLLRTNVQLGADYSVSIDSTRRVAEGGEAARQLFNATSADEVVFGSSSTQVVENLARAIENDVKEGDEFVITGEHEGAYQPYAQWLDSSCGLLFPSQQWPMEEAWSTPRCYIEVLAANTYGPEQPLLHRTEDRGAPSTHHVQDTPRYLHRMLEHPRIDYPGEGSH